MNIEDLKVGDVVRVTEYEYTRVQWLAVVFSIARVRVGDGYADALVCAHGSSGDDTEEIIVENTDVWTLVPEDQVPDEVWRVWGKWLLTEGYDASAD